MPGGTRARHVRAHYDFDVVEERWRRAWEERGIYRTPEPDPSRPKQYVLDFFPYPSGEGLSVGHARNYVPTDVLARYYRMRGFAILHPMGWDAFGLPAENEALVKGRHPRETTAEYAATYRRQLSLLGCSYDWRREITTSDPAFYRWTQWGFLLLLKRGLAYRAVGWQWWCPRCRTILANEQVEDGRCWRHGDTPVERKALEQWYVRTTGYADRLLADLEDPDWPESIKRMQRNWIGRSEGAEVRFRVLRAERAIETFTTRVDTIFGVTFIALAPEHPSAQDLAAPDRRDAVGAFVRQALRRTEVDRMADRGVPPGISTGAFAVHPLTGERVPIYVADYVVAQYGSGAVMGVPAHDARDLAFARAHGLPERNVIVDGAGVTSVPYTGDGRLVDSGDFTGMESDAARTAITHELARREAGQAVVRYRMRDWLISRQRYWGAPIPVVHCPDCGVVPVPEQDLPVMLPHVEHYEPSGTGESPLAAIPSFVETTCPSCAGAARRETDTLDGFADSNWYFLRFSDPTHPEGPWRPDAAAYWLPVDWYVGGAEHAVMHLLYARFFTKVLFDAGLVAFSEPFARLRNQGSMLSPADGTRMSKSRGNVITPDEVAARYGADALRIYELFIGPFDQDVTWDPRGMVGAARFVQRLFGLVTREVHPPRQREPAASETDALAIRGRLHSLVRMAGDLLQGFRFNVLVAELMKFVNEAERWEPTWTGTALWREVTDTLLRVTAPLVPFLAEEAWHRRGGVGSVHLAPWPAYDPGSAVREEQVAIVVQVDGRLRDRLVVPAGLDRTELTALVMSRDRVRRALSARRVVDVIIVPGRLANVVTGVAKPSPSSR